MTLIDQLASSLNRRDEAPNQELAKKITARKDKASIRELVAHLSHNNKDIQNDCIKVLYEIGETDASLISPYIKEFLALLKSKSNRLQWGAMAALSSITSENPKAVYGALSQIIAAAEAGSVITRDHAVNILVKLCRRKQYADDAFALLNEQLLNSPANQLPMYAENALPLINEKNKQVFIKTLTSRLDDIEKDTKRKRVEKVIQQLRK